MKALILRKYTYLVYEDVTEPTIGEKDVLVRVKACGICGSDVHGMDGSSGRRLPPIIMGHEASGVVEKLGSRITDIKIGARVAIDSTLYCGECSYCFQGLHNLCDNRRVIGVSCDEYTQNGAFADYVAVPARGVYPLPDDLSFEKATMVEPVSIAVHAVNLTPFMLNDNAVVVGSGIIGLLIIQALRAAGCGRLIAVDIDENKLSFARDLGADNVFQADKPNLVNEILQLTRGKGADIVFDAVGRSAATMLALECVKKGGSLTLIGNLDASINLALQKVVTRQITLRGSCASSSFEYPECLAMISRGTIDVDRLISSVAPLKDGSDWFKRLYQAEEGLMKVILKP